MNECERKLGLQLSMVNSYIQLMPLTTDTAQDEMLSTPSFTQSLHAATDGSVSAQDWETSTLGEASVSVRQPATVPTRPKQFLSASMKGLILSSKQRSTLVADLYQACEYRNVNKVNELLQKYAPVNAAAKDGKRPLHCAVKSGQFTIIKLLIDNGADVNKKDANHDPPLAIAIQEAEEAIAALLIKSDADVNGTSGGFSTMLSLAINKKDERLVRLLVQNGANVTPDQPGSGYSTLLAAAVAARDEKIVLLLLQAGADCQIHTPGQASKGQKSLPLIVAINARNLEVCRHLLQFGADTRTWFDNEEHSDESPFSHLVKDNLQIALLLVEYGAHVTLSKDYLQIIHKTTPSETVRQVLQAGVGIDLSQDALMEIAREYQDLARTLLDSGRQLSLPLGDADGGGTTLISAIMDNNVRLMELLLDYGAKPGGPQKSGLTPLCAALLRHEVAGEMVTLLLSRGADPNERCSDVILQHSRFVQVDKSYIGEDVEVPYHKLDGNHPSFYNSHGHICKDVRPLHVAVRTGCRCCDGAIESLIDHGADVNATYSHDQPTAELRRQRDDLSSNALGYTNISVLHLAKEEAHVKMLLEAGASVKAKDGLGHTPLLWALFVGDSLTVLPLLNGGSSVFNCSAGGKDALELWHDQLDHNLLRRPKKFHSTHHLTTHTSLLCHLMDHGAIPDRPLRMKNSSVLKDITWEITPDVTEQSSVWYWSFLRVCWDIMKTYGAADGGYRRWKLCVKYRDDGGWRRYERPGRK